MKISEQGLELIKHFESLHDGDLTKIGLQPKRDSVGIITIGYGHALLDPKGKWIKDIKQVEKYYPQYLNIDEKQATHLLLDDTIKYSNKINSLNLSLKQHQFDALVSFSFNVGFKALCDSTLLKRIKEEFTTDELIRDAFLMWNKAGGKILSGLTRRRKSEALLFTKGELNFYE